MMVKLDDRTYTVWIHFWTLFMLPGYRTRYPVVWLSRNSCPIHFKHRTECAWNPTTWDADGFLSRFSNPIYLGLHEL
jgi:hypothetical protein